MKTSPIIAVVWRGDREERRTARPDNNRFHRIFDELAAQGIVAEPAVYNEEFAEDVRAQLLKADGVLVWVNPLQDGKNRLRLDSLLRDVASHGTWVSAHPDVIAKMGTKEVLYQTRAMSWGSDTDIYRTPEAMRAGLLAKLPRGARVVKRNRGNGGQGVWKAEAVPPTGDQFMVRVLDATKDTPEDLELEQFLVRCADYFDDGCVIDQAFQPRLGEGVVRCYMAGDRCAGFGHQKVKALVTGPDRTGAGPREYSSNADPRFQRLRRLMEDEWTPQLTSLLELRPSDLPMIWDADFMLGAPDARGNDSYVLGEINISSVFPIPDEAPAEIVHCVAGRLRADSASR